MSIEESNVDKLSQQSIIDCHGRPKDELTLKIVGLFFDPPFPPSKPSFTIQDVADLLAADISKTESIIKQLVSEQIVSEDSQNPGIFRYNYHCPFVEHQARLEKYLLEEEMKHSFADSTIEFLPYNPN